MSFLSSLFAGGKAAASKSSTLKGTAKRAAKRATRAASVPKAALGTPIMAKPGADPFGHMTKAARARAQATMANGQMMQTARPRPSRPGPALSRPNRGEGIGGAYRGGRDRHRANVAQAASRKNKRRAIYAGMGVGAAGATAYAVTQSSGKAVSPTGYRESRGNRMY